MDRYKPHANIWVLVSFLESKMTARMTQDGCQDGRQDGRQKGKLNISKTNGPILVKLGMWVLISLAHRLNDVFG